MHKIQQLKLGLYCYRWVQTWKTLQLKNGLFFAASPQLVEHIHCYILMKIFFHSLMLFHMIASQNHGKVIELCKANESSQKHMEPNARATSFVVSNAVLSWAVHAFQSHGECFHHPSNHFTCCILEEDLGP